MENVASLTFMLMLSKLAIVATWTTLGQLCAALWDYQSQPDVIQPGFEPGTVVTHLALSCSELRVAQRSNALHLSAKCVTTVPGSNVIGSPIGWCTIGPASSGLGFGRSRPSL